MATKIEAPEYVACDECNGRGRVAVCSGYSRTFNDYGIEDDCERCSGTGQLRVLTEAEEQAIWDKIHEELMASVRETKAAKKAEAERITSAFDAIEAKLDGMVVR